MALTKIPSELSSTTGIVDNSNATAITIDSNENVGIGTSSPDTKLHVEGNILCDAFNNGGAGNGIFFRDGLLNTAQPSITLADHSGAHPDGLSINAYDGISFRTADSERMRIDASGNVGIGTSSPDTLVQATNTSASTNYISYEIGNSGIGSANKGGFAIYELGGLATSITYARDGTGHTDFNADTLVFNNAANTSERMRIDASGNLLVGTTSAPSSSVTGWRVISSVYPYVQNSVADTAFRYAYEFINPNGTVGTISTSGSTTSYNTSSDYRLKENVVELTGATERLKQLKPSRFNFIVDADTTVDGFLAHEVADVVPEAISGEKDAMKDEEYEVTPAVLDEEGNVVTEAVIGTRSVPEYQGIDQSKLVPLLVATIQELEARITELENN